MHSDNQTTEQVKGKEKKEKESVVKFSKQQKDEDVIDLLDLMLCLWEKIHYIILCLMLGAVLCNAYSYFCIEPTYQSTAKLYVVSASEDSIVNLTDLNIGSTLTSDYEELILSYPVLNQVIDKLELDMTAEQLAGMISLVNPTNTRVLAITVTSTNPQLACDIANTLANISTEYLPDTMSTRAPNIAQIARVAKSKTAPNCIKYTLIGAILGALIYCLIVFINYRMDDTIHTADDLEKYFGIVPLTTIPENEQFHQSDSGEGTNTKTTKKGFWKK